MRNIRKAISMNPEPGFQVIQNIKAQPIKVPLNVFKKYLWSNL